MAVVATVHAGVTVQETIGSGAPAASAGQTTVTQSAWNINDRLEATSTPPVDSGVAIEGTIGGGGTTDLDLTSLTGLNSAAYNFSGKKIQALLFRTPSTATGAQTIGPGAANGYALFGGTVALPNSPGEQFVKKWKDTLPDVDGTHKVVRVTGTAGETYQLVLVAG